MARHPRTAHPDSEDELPPLKISGESLREAIGLAAYLWPYRLKFVAALAALFLSSLLGLAFPYLAGLLVNAAISVPSPAALPAAHNVDTITLALLLVLALQAAFSFIRSLWFIEVGERTVADLRRDTYARLVRLPMAFHTRRRVGELSSRIATDLTQIGDTLIGLIPQLLRQVTLLVGGIVLLTLTSVRLTGVMLASLPALIAVAVLFGRAIRRISRAAQDRLADTSVVVEETLQGIASVKAFGNESYEEDRYRHGLTEYLKVILRSARYRGAFVSFVVFALFGAVVGVLWYGARMVHGGQLTPGALTSFMLYTLFVAGAMGSFAELYGDVQRTLGATHRVRELLREEPEVLVGQVSNLSGRMDKLETCPTKPISNLSRDSAPRLRGDVAFEHVAFSYPSRKEVEVLRDVCLEARAGERLALVGPSGAGKSTIVALLLRFYEPDRGRILIDGRDARDYGLHELRSQTAIGPQDVFLFGGTIFENIAYGKPGSTEDEVVEAARRANAHDFITSFPEGYQTRVGERGAQLSGGQRQRVAIARAILRDPAVLILDEATSSLDSESESLVLQALDRLMQGRTSIIIAHRLSTVRTADRIVVIKEGRTVESGTHAQLMTREDGLYRALSELQLDLTASPAPDTREDDPWPTPPRKPR